jgi:predicted PurR-regulated permease PerM
MRSTDGLDAGRTAWLLLGIAIAAVIVVALTTYLGALLFAVFLYFATRPLYHRLNGRLDRPNVAVTLTLLAVVLPLVVVVGYAGLLALQELSQFLSTHSLDGLRSSLQPYLGLVREGRVRELWRVLVTDPGQPLDPAVQRVLEGALGRVTTVAGVAFAVVSQLFLMSILLFYFLRDDDKVRDWFFESVGYDQRVVEFVSKVSDDLQTVFFGNLLIVAVSGGVAAVTYLLLNAVSADGSVVATPVLLGLLIGIGTLIPLVGMKVVYVPYTAYLVALAVTGGAPVWHPVVFLLLTFVVVDAVPDFFIRSYLASRGSVHMGLVLVGYALGTLAFGWAGLFLGPVVVVLAVHFGRLIFPRLVRDLSA